MINRKQKIEELLEAMGSFKHNMAPKGISTMKMPRITPSQWGVLMLIEQRGNITVKGVAVALHISSSAVTQLIDGLVKSGYVKREIYIKDRRAVTLTLSKKSKNQVEKMKKQMVRNFLKAFEILTDKEFNQYHICNKKIMQRFSNKKLILC